MTVAELAAAGVPVRPRAAAGRPRGPPGGQRPRARRAGAAVLVPDADCTRRGLAAQLDRLLGRARDRLDGHGASGARRSAGPTPPTPAPGVVEARARPTVGGGTAVTLADRAGDRDLGALGVHVVGIGGAGMSGIATVLRAWATR